MNKTSLIYIAAVCGLLTALAPTSHSEVVDWNQLPVVVQRAVNDQRGPVGILSIERLDRFGAPVYEVRLNRPGPDNRFVVTETGTLVNLTEVISLPRSD